MQQANRRWRLPQAQKQQIVAALKLETELVEETLARIERACAEYHVAATVEPRRSGKEGNRKRAEQAGQLRMLEVAAQAFQEALGALGPEAGDELRREYRIAALREDADRPFNLRHLRTTAGRTRVAARRAVARFDPPKTGRPRERPALRKLIAQLAGIFEGATGRRPAPARNRDNPDEPRGRFEQLVCSCTKADPDAAEPLPTGLIREVCELWPDLRERCWLILSRPGMAPATRIECLIRAKAMYRRGLSKRDKECRGRLQAVLCSDLDDDGKTEAIREFIAQTLDKLSAILGTGPSVVDTVGVIARK